MSDKRDTPLVNLTENAYLDQLKERTVRSDPFGMLKETMPGRQKKVEAVQEEEEKAIDKEDKTI